jgi:hypothetical protein
MFWRRLYRELNEPLPPGNDLDIFLMRVTALCAVWTAVQTGFLMYIMSSELRIMQEQAEVPAV